MLRKSTKTTRINSTWSINSVNFSYCSTYVSLQFKYCFWITFAICEVKYWQKLKLLYVYSLKVKHIVGIGWEFRSMKLHVGGSHFDISPSLRGVIDPATQPSTKKSTTSPTSYTTLNFSARSNDKNNPIKFFIAPENVRDIFA